MYYRFFYLIPFLAQLTFGQVDIFQVKIQSTTKINVPFAGTMSFLNTIDAMEGRYKEEVESKYDRFYTRMAMGGNRIAGKLLINDDQSLVMYNDSKKEYSEQDFQSIRENNGKPSIKDLTRMNPGGGNNSESRDSGSDKGTNENERPRPTIERSVSDELVKINQFMCQKVTTRISSPNGAFTMIEWITDDTLVFSFADKVQQELIESYGGTFTRQPTSDNWLNRLEPKNKYNKIAGKIVKSTMTSYNEKDKPSFSMEMEISLAKKVEIDTSTFKIPDNYRKVDVLE